MQVQSDLVDLYMYVEGERPHLLIDFILVLFFENEVSAYVDSCQTYLPDKQAMRLKRGV